MLIPRRVVTGHDARGRSVVLSDGPVPVVHERPEDRARFFEVWSTDASPAPIAPAEREPAERPLQIPPRAHGTVIRVTELEPGARSPMHRTETIDYGIVLSGELVLVLDDGAEVTVRAGDIVVQRGTDHAWANRSGETVRVAFVLVDGAFAPGLPPPPA